MAGSLGSHLAVGSLVHDLGSLKESSSLELCGGKWEMRESQRPGRPLLSTETGEVDVASPRDAAQTHLVFATQLHLWLGKC